MSNEPKKSLYQQTGLIVGRSYTRQKIRIALGKIYHSSVVLDWFKHFQENGFIEMGNANPLSANLDHLTIKKDFING